MTTSIVSTFPPDRCGIADYTDNLCKLLGKTDRVKHVHVKPGGSLNPFYYLLLALESAQGADSINVQYESSFFGTLKLKLWFSGLYTGLYYRLISGLVPREAITSTVHEVQDNHKYHGLVGKAHRWYYRHVYNPVLSMSGHVCVHSRRALNLLSEYGDTSNVTITPYPLYQNVHPIDNGEAKNSLGLSGKKVLLLFGYIDRGKGHTVALDALKNMPDDVILYVAGGERERGYLEVLNRYAASLGVWGQVWFHGFVNETDLDMVFSAADIILLPYSDSMQSSVLYRALSYGKPVVASDIESFKEAAETYPIYLFEHGNAAMLCEAILSCLKC